MQWRNDVQSDHYVTVARAPPGERTDWVVVHHVGSRAFDEPEADRTVLARHQFGTQDAAFGHANGYMNRSPAGHDVGAGDERATESATV